MTLDQMKVSNKFAKKHLAKIDLCSDLIPSIHIIIPVFNESCSIICLIDRIHQTMKQNYDYKITVIDDGSTDNTYSLLKQSGLNINLLKNRVNLGKGKTLKKGFTYISLDEIVVMIDGDGEHPPEDILNLIQPIIDRKAEVVIGSRFLNLDKKKGYKSSYLKNGKHFSQFRKLGNLLISLLIFIFHHRYISDTQCGFRAFAPGIAQLFNPKYSGFEIETEMTIFYIRKNAQIIEVPIDTGLSTRESHMSILRDSLRILLVILAMNLKK